ncbi:BNR repeat-containing protein [Mariniflexile litorale]|uniref:BNR repeat-containing protein n=1 Tax=Mariniflexile litorale TaxID=3045158 RepID=A0AAU7EIN3_9FLAO|nr:BNR repeat-containing protein [Mariniflexile sp. KMM 9835]MDQ8210685.1 BNR repeat-containing protein [Mariniflexile sp. KMM 9835]
MLRKNKIVLLLKRYVVLITGVVCAMSCGKNISYSYIGEGWSSNSVNTVKFRKNALTTSGKYQFVAYYDQESYLILGKRTLHSQKWKLLKTPYKGHTKDAHNTISIAVDGDGFLHVSWDHHNTSLKYTKSKQPYSLELEEEMSMTGIQEDKITYPEFYNLPNGNLLFFYRSGQSGRGNLVINTYDLNHKKWTQLQNNLIDGENKRSAYWQACVDAKGVVHISWVWRETWDVETNHDVCYTQSEDGGKTWKKSSGEKYNLPITQASAEYAWRIPQKKNLINQTAMTVDKYGNPYIVTYWNENKIPQYQIVYLEDDSWKKINTGFRKTAFTLGGGGTKKIPISRPDILIDDSKKYTSIHILFRDLERQNKVSMASTILNKTQRWEIKDLSETSVGEWEPNYDTALWNSRKKLHLFTQKVTQIDGEGVASKNASEVRVLQIKNLNQYQN